MSKLLIASLLTCSPLLQTRAWPAERQMEYLDRGLVATPQNEGRVFVSWRLLGTDPEGIGFNLYRSQAGNERVKLNEAPITEATCFVDQAANGNQMPRYF